MTDIFIYCGLLILLAGVVFGFFLAIKGFKETDWNAVRSISVWSNFQRGAMSPQMKRLTGLWITIMIIGLILIGIGLTLCPD